jgi:hypothetical protein
VLGRKRWEGTTKEQRAAHALSMIAARDAGKTKKQISAEARAAVNARWKRVKEAGTQGVEESGSQEAEREAGRWEAEEVIAFRLAASSGVHDSGTGSAFPARVARFDLSLDPGGRPRRFLGSAGPTAACCIQAGFHPLRFLPCARP